MAGRYRGKKNAMSFRGLTSAATQPLDAEYARHLEAYDARVEEERPRREVKMPVFRIQRIDVDKIGA